MARVKREEKCPWCKRGTLEMIGVDDRRQYKWCCTKCYRIIIKGGVANVERLSAATRR